MSSQFNDTEDDTPLYTRRAGAADAVGGDRRADEFESARQPEREVTLNTGIVLALFFALALLCAVFFGFGYSIGHKSVPPPAIVDADSAPADATVKAGPKPAPGLAAPPPVPEYVPPTGTERAAPKAAAATPVTPSPARGTTTDAAPVHTAAPARLPAASTTEPAAGPAVATGSAAAGSSFVQIAAVSHQEDADVLLSALRRRGYAVQTRSETADKLIHVQIGPFSNRKEAEAMRQKLAGDGYNAFIK